MRQKKAKYNQTSNLKVLSRKEYVTVWSVKCDRTRRGNLVF